MRWFTRINKMNSRDWCIFLNIDKLTNGYLSLMNPLRPSEQCLTKPWTEKKNTSFNSCHVYVERNPNSAEIWAPLIITNSFGSAAEWNKASPFLANSRNKVAQSNRSHTRFGGYCVVDQLSWGWLFNLGSYRVFVHHLGKGLLDINK